MSRVDLPSGGWVEMRDTTSITHGERKRYTTLVAELTVDTYAESAKLVEALLAFAIKAWSFDQAVPTFDEAIAGGCDHLTAPDFDRLSEEMPAYSAVMYGKTEGEHPLDPKAAAPASTG